MGIKCPEYTRKSYLPRWFVCWCGRKKGETCEEKCLEKCLKSGSKCHFKYNFKDVERFRVSCHCYSGCNILPYIDRDSNGKWFIGWIFWMYSF